MERIQNKNRAVIVDIALNPTKILSGIIAYALSLSVVHEYFFYKKAGIEFFYLANSQDYIKYTINWLPIVIASLIVSFISNYGLVVISDSVSLRVKNMYYPTPRINKIYIISLLSMLLLSALTFLMWLFYALYKMFISKNMSMSIIIFTFVVFSVNGAVFICRKKYNISRLGVVTSVAVCLAFLFSAIAGELEALKLMGGNQNKTSICMDGKLYTVHLLRIIDKGLLYVSNDKRIIFIPMRALSCIAPVIENNDRASVIDSLTFRYL